MRSVGAPLVLLIVLGTVVGLIIIALTAFNPLGTAIGLVLSSVAMVGVVLAYLWLDRWEPEPPRLLVLAFLWGASVAVVLSVVLTLVLGVFVDGVLAGFVGPDAVDSGGYVSLIFPLVIGAPVVEEIAKGLFLLVMMTGRRRYELNSLTDCLVYAGLVGAGFAWLEDILYIASGGSLGESLLTAVLRLVLAPFAHSLFTSFTAVGVYFALQRRGPAARFGCIALGYVGAVIMHALWNGSSLLGFGAYLAVYVLWMVPVFALTIGLALHSRRREQHVVASKLPGMVAAGLITPNEATWLGSIAHRKLAIAQARRYAGPAAAAAVRTFATQVVEVAFVRDRIDRGFGDQRVTELLQEEVNALAAARAAAPALHTLAGFQPPGSTPIR
ncbi:MAG: PrsW family intramembrane metalloprotease [Mycolicibacterium hassiacum]|jgi:RsiW-degrading membrane proteinase PrsW (M82 family)|uniref:PrsW family intramembrane metalloprotease n=1 Tax=Mycolicibacterium hassiacum TaxID=46351 RepID=UPI0023F9098A|nr:PrsW family intramembrane metalloprotease [Mycolicibacterium hassiacum]MBX5487083.1 PrsW family intramembrane metalloprotease [Mycolicibacterium hassiacum]